MLTTDFDLGKEFDKMPSHIDKASWFLGIAAYQNMITDAQKEPEHKHGTIVALMHFEVEIELGKLLGSQT